MNKFKKIIIALISVAILLPLCAFGYLYFKINKMYVPDEKVKNETTSNEETVKGVTNILLAGIDGENIDMGNRSDSMMILTVDNVNKSIKLTSLARDTYVDIEGYSTEKLTHAYAYEGAPLLMDTIKKNFGINVDKYVAVNFNSFIDVVNLIGGVEVNVEERNIKIINDTINACYPYDKNPDKGPIEYIEEAGVQNLNGYQALAFSRIRYTDSAYARDERQREVIQSAISKLTKMSPTKYMSLLDIGVSNMKTNMSPMEMVKLATTAIKINDKEIAQMEFPVYKDGKTIEGKGWVIEWDKESNLKALNDFIYKDIQPEE